MTMGSAQRDGRRRNGLGIASFLLACAGVGAIGILLPGCTETRSGGERSTDMADTSKAPGSVGELATFGAGCFWCVEAVLLQVDGVLGVTSGYMGGDVEEPTYKDVCTGRTGHAEVVQVRFDPAKLRYGDLLAWFWRLHDPTTPNRQGADSGTQYRSVVFFHSEAQREAAVKSKAAEDAAGRHPAPIVTEIAPAGPFWPAEGDHQDFYRQNRAHGYCRSVIAPKLEKLGLSK